MILSADVFRPCPVCSAPLVPSKVAADLGDCEWTCCECWTWYRQHGRFLVAGGVHEFTRPRGVSCDPFPRVAPPYVPFELLPVLERISAEWRASTAAEQKAAAEMQAGIDEFLRLPKRERKPTFPLMYYDDEGNAFGPQYKPR